MLLGIGSIPGTSVGTAFGSISRFVFSAFRPRLFRIGQIPSVTFDAALVAQQFGISRFQIPVMLFSAAFNRFRIIAILAQTNLPMAFDAAVCQGFRVNMTALAGLARKVMAKAKLDRFSARRWQRLKIHL